MDRQDFRVSICCPHKCPSVIFDIECSKFCYDVSDKDVKCRHRLSIVLDIDIDLSNECSVHPYRWTVVFSFPGSHCLADRMSVAY